MAPDDRGRSKRTVVDGFSRKTNRYRIELNRGVEVAGIIGPREAHHHGSTLGRCCDGEMPSSSHQARTTLVTTVEITRQSDEIDTTSRTLR